MLAEIGAKHGIHLTMVAAWKKAAIDGMTSTFSPPSGVALAASAGKAECAPWIRTLRKYLLPRLLIPSSRGLPPVVTWRGTSPSQAARSRALAKVSALPIAAISAVALSTPMPATVLSRKAIVYVRQSTQTQVQINRESQRRQYDLVEEARRRGFRDVEVIDDDLGRSASGTVARPGFERLVASLCAGEVGAVFCFDASRLSRNGRDWHHLLELCGLVGARVINLDGVYDPCRPNDRLLLGMKGSISEFELGVLRSRMLDAARSKARRGELRIPVPIGYVWHREIGLGFDPDRRVQEVTRGIFQRFRELGSARQVHLALKVEGVHFPRPSDGKRMTAFDWTPIRYRNVISLLKNPFYAGAYSYGKSVNRAQTVDGRARKTYGHHRPLHECEILLKDHHEGYIDWEEFERNQTQLAANAYGRKDGAKSGRGGAERSGQGSVFDGVLPAGGLCVAKRRHNSV